MSDVPQTTEKRLDRELKAKWLEALRSGQFKQCEGKLHRVLTDSYCCLGVLQSIASIPQSPAGELLDSKCGLQIDVQQKLAGMNDDGDSFSEIADWIEANV